MLQPLRSSTLSTDAAVGGWFAAYLLVLVLRYRAASERIVHETLAFLRVEVVRRQLPRAEDLGGREAWRAATAGC